MIKKEHLVSDISKLKKVISVPLKLGRIKN